MAYNEPLAERIRIALDNHPDISEKKMFGGLSFLYRGKMSVGIIGDDLIVRVVAEKMEEVLRRPMVGPMVFTGKAMKEFVTVSPDGWDHADHLQGYIELGIEHAKRKTGSS